MLWACNGLVFKKKVDNPMYPDTRRLIFLLAPTATGPMPCSESGVALHLIEWSLSYRHQDRSERRSYQVTVEGWLPVRDAAAVIFFVRNAARSSCGKRVLRLGHFTSALLGQIFTQTKYPNVIWRCVCVYVCVRSWGDNMRRLRHIC